jgi:AraC-like DNA-binding protein
VASSKNAAIEAFGVRNIILSGKARRHYVARFAGPIAIKTAAYGRVEWRLEGKSYVVRPDTLLLLPEGDEYAMTIDTPALSRTFCPVFCSGIVERAWHALKSAEDSLLDEPDAQPVLSFSRRFESRNTPLGRAVESLARAAVNNAPTVVLDWHFEMLAARTARAIATHRSEPSKLNVARAATRIEVHRRLTRAREAMEDNLAAAWTLATMAHVAAMSPHHFNRRFGETFGEPPRRWLSRRRAERAMALLRTSRLSVTEVCFAVGYESLGSFSSAFSRRFGVAPSRAAMTPSSPEMW